MKYQISAIKAISALPLPVLGRGQARILLELPAEAGGVEIAHRHANLIDGLVRVPEQLLCLVQAKLPQIIRKILVHFFFHQITDIGDAEMEPVRQLGDGEIRIGEIGFNQGLQLVGVGGLGGLLLPEEVQQPFDILPDQGILAARDKLGRLPVLIGQNSEGCCVSFESFAYQKLGYENAYELGPQEIVKITAEGFETVSPAGEDMKICAFLWTYYGYPNSNYQGVNVELMRYRNGEIMARNEKADGSLPEVD